MFRVPINLRLLLNSLFLKFRYLEIAILQFTINKASFFIFEGFLPTRNGVKFPNSRILVLTPLLVNNFVHIKYSLKTIARNLYAQAIEQARNF